MKILSPAGNLISLKAAIFCGADEVYLGINNFNARNNIDGFNLDNLQEAVDFAHIHNVAVSLAINILFKNSELQSALDTVVSAYNIGVDYFIIQDLGLISLIHKFYPEITIHASTQMGLHNLEGIKVLEDFNIKRVVLARETPLEEIKRIKDSHNIEIEYFAQGALCVCFSGNCYISSYLHNASGNRGLCKQLCRLPYTLTYQGKRIKSGYLLSAKDFNTLNKLQDLQDAGVDVLKIEGRARRAYYVGTATQEYYNALHNITPNTDKLKLAFNREYTAGYFNGNGNIISPYHNHIGIKIGNVEKVNLGKKFNEIYFSSNREISPKSTLKIYHDKVETNTLTAYDLKSIANGKYLLTTTQTVKPGDDVHLISDNKLEEDLLNLNKRRQVDIKIIAKENLPIKAITSINDSTIEITGDICSPAIKRPITIADINLNFSKSDIFDANLDILTLDNIFMPMQQLNEFRRNVFSTIYNEIVSKYRHKLEKNRVDTSYNIIKFDNFQIIENPNDRLTSNNIIYSPEEYNPTEIAALKSKCDKLGLKLYLDTPNFALAKDIEILTNIINQTQIGIIANNYYALTFNTEIIIGAGLNTYNNVTASVYNKPIITAESNISSKIKYPYMTLRHCPMKSHLQADCNRCPFKTGYTYIMESGKEFKLKRKKLSTCTFYLTD